MVRQEKNLWVAAGDGDLQRVRELIEQHGLLIPLFPRPCLVDQTPQHRLIS